VVARWPLVGRDAELAELRSLLASTRGPQGVAVFGDAGVGKTRLINEVVESAREAGGAVEWVRATEAARSIPLGSFAHLLAPGDDAQQRDDLLHVALSRLHERSAGGDFLLAVDDAHLLDDVSVALLHLAVTQSDIKVLASIRTGEPLPIGLAALWKDELLARLDVAPLSHESTEQLVLAVLGDRVPASMVDRVWQLSRGNALFLRELVTAAIERRQGGGTGRTVVLPEGPRERLRELVEERLRLLEPGCRALLETIAVGEQVPLDAAERLASADGDLDDLEQRGLIEVVDIDPVGSTDPAGPADAAPGPGPISVVQVAHPLYGEVLAAGLPRLRHRGVLRDLVGAVAGIEGFDRLRLATWRLESGVPGDPDQLLGLAREALGRLDHRLAERLAMAAGGTSRADAGLVVSEALSGQGRKDEAEAVLARLRPADPEQVARIAIARASDLFLYLDRSAEAFDVLRMAVEDLQGHRAWQAECRSVMAQMHMFTLQMTEAGRIADALLASDETPEPARVRAVTVAVSSWGAQGRLDDALALLTDDLYASARRHRRDVPYGELQLRMARFQVLFWTGRADELDRFTADALGLDLSHPPPSLLGIVAGFRGGALLQRGKVKAGLAELQRSSRALAENDWFGQKPLAEAMRARAAVFCGELAVADEALEAAQAAFELDPLRGARTLPYIELSRAWLLAAQGSVSEAAQKCLGLAMAMELVAKPIAVEALHAAVRLGRAADAIDGLERLATCVDGPLSQLALRHARALTAPGSSSGANADDLAALAADFEVCGADLLAVEVYRSAANAYRRQGKGASASTLARKVEDLLTSCGNPRSPAMEPVASTGEELTDREREVARLAASGRTSPEIAEALYLSVRTVDTHLHRVYRKLAIDGRRQLAEALGFGPPTHPGP
jgi:DNA-binding CsgD family transcriptional regulator